MSKIVNISSYSESAENMYYDYMTSFWNEYDLYWELSNGGFFLWTAYIDADNSVMPRDSKVLAAAANLIIIEYNKERILQEGHTAFKDPMSLLTSFYEIDTKEINKIYATLNASTMKISFDTSVLAWNEDADEQRREEEDDEFDDFKLTPEFLKAAEEIMNNQCNIHVRIEFDESLTMSSGQLSQEVNDILLEISGNSSFNLYHIYLNETDISFSIDCVIGLMLGLEERMEERYQLVPEFVVIRDLKENAFTPDKHYIHFMDLYGDMNVPELIDKHELNSYIEKFSKLTPQERRKQNPNAREDDDFSAIQLYILSREEGMEKAKSIINTNRHNIEAQILIAGWEGDLEKRIDMLTAASDMNNLDYDYKQIDKDKLWWGAHHTRPLMRAKYLLAKTYELGGYIDDAIDGYKEIIVMNPTDNQGARLELVRILYEIDDKKELASLVNKFPDEVDEYFAFGNVYTSFMKHGKSSKTEKKIIFSLKINYYLACAIAKIDADLFTDLLNAPEDEDEVLFEKFEEVYGDIMPLFRNVELNKYYSKMIKELYHRISLQ